MRKISILLAALGALAILVPAQAQAFKPEIVEVRATDDSDGIFFTAKVRMDKRGDRDDRKVSIKYDGDRKRAKVLDDPPVSMYQAGPWSAPVRDCYRVKVTATNEFGVTKKRVRAGLIGTDGCN